jgi:chaperonin GroES
MRLRPLQDRVLIRRVEQEAITSGDLFIPDTAQEKPTEGEIVGIRPGLHNEAGELHPPDVKVGDRVLFGKWSGTQMKRNGEDLMIMKEADLLAVIDRSIADQQTA